MSSTPPVVEAAEVEETGRFRQRRRTRAAIVAAATQLLRSGRTPSVNDVAEAADVSRRTVYQYFPTLEQLLIDATLGMLAQTAVDEAIDAADAGGDVNASSMENRCCGVNVHRPAAPGPRVAGRLRYHSGYGPRRS